MSAPERPSAGSGTGSPPESAFAEAEPLVADTVARLRRAMRRAARATDPGNPLAVAQLELLSAVADEPGVRPGRLARRLRLAPNSVTTLVNGLQSRGLITRAAAADDARAVALTLTDAGRQAVDAWKDTNAAIIQTALRTLTGRHYRALAQALPALRELTQAIDEIADAPPATATPGDVARAREHPRRPAGR
jgi:DNA-binding MarR family transcriptional regulator